MRYIKLIREFFDDWDDSSYTLNTDEISNDFSLIEDILKKDCSEFLKIAPKDRGIYRGVKYADNVNIDGKPISGLYKKISRNNRNTLDMKPRISKEIDDIFEKKFNIRLRQNSTFATKNIYHSQEYISDDNWENGFLMFPIGKFDYYINPDIMDLYTSVSDQVWYNEYDNYLKYSFDRYKTFKEDDIYYQYLYNYIENNYDSINKEHNIKIDKHRIADYFKYVPKMSEELFNKYRDKEITKIVDGYVKNGDLNISPTGDDYEICFVCKEYYLVDNRYVKEILNMIYKL